ncbi:ATP-binding protein [Pseudomonas palleroniana]|uniref:ATP-binding protein n=1 Tax=Pseudomonas palleroniana TaxID=191390 RepID=UPI003B00E6FC
MVVFVAGVHGVGKTYLCERFATHSGIRHSSASALIKEERKSANWESNKLVSDIDSNQFALTAAVKRVTADSKKLLLDGHFVLKKSDGSLAAVHEDTFKELNLSAVLLIEVDPETVRQRLLSRDSNASAGDVADFLLAERERAVCVSEQLRLPLTILHKPSQQEFDNHLNNIFKIYQD